MRHLGLSFLVLAVLMGCSDDKSGEKTESEEHSTAKEGSETGPAAPVAPPKTDQPKPLDPGLQFIFEGAKEDLASLKSQLNSETQPISMNVVHAGLVHKMAKLKEACSPQLTAFLGEAEKTALLDYPLAVAMSRSKEIQEIRSKNPSEKYMSGCTDFDLALQALKDAGHGGRIDVKSWLALYSEACE